MEDLRKLEGIISKALETEAQAAYSYFFGLDRLRAVGYSDPELENSVRKIAVETVIHKHLMEGLLKALNELSKIDQSFSSLEERAVTAHELSGEVKMLLKRFSEMHLKIEEDMIATYKKLAEEAEHPLVKKLAEALVENEERHHKYLASLISELA